MTFPVPKDVRAVRDFEIVKGIDGAIRTPLMISDPTKSYVVGEWVKLNTVAAGKATKVVVADDIDEPVMGARLCWTLFQPGDSFSGQADALATTEIDTLSGHFQAKTKLYDSAGTYSVGCPLVVIYDTVNARGYLAPLDPATATARQLAAVVGRCIQVADGQLYFEANY